MLAPPSLTSWAQVPSDTARSLKDKRNKILNTQKAQLLDINPKVFNLLLGSFVKGNALIERCLTGVLFKAKLISHTITDGCPIVPVQERYQATPSVTLMSVFERSEVP